MRCKNCGFQNFVGTKICPNCGSVQKKHEKLKFWHIIVAILFLPIFLGYLVSTIESTIPNKELNNLSTSDQGKKPKDLNQNVKLLFDFDTGIRDERAKSLNKFMGNSGISDKFYVYDEPLLEVMVRFENHNDVQVCDINYLCYHFAESGSKVDTTKGTRFICLPPKGYLFRTIEFGFVNSKSRMIECYCTGLRVVKK